MTLGRKIYLMGIVMYTIIASILSPILKIEWIHIFNALILSAILFHILEWKYDWVEEEGKNDI